MDYQYILTEQSDDGIVVVTINDPGAKNAVNWEMNKEIFAEITRVEEDPSARVIILTGSGDIFCSGGNIKRMTAEGKSLLPPEPTLHEQMYPQMSDIKRVILSLRKMSKPVIAAINGPAIGSGLGIAAGCDMRIAADTARFGWVYTRRGIVADDGSVALMPQIVGYAKAFEWGISGETFDAKTAQEAGFVKEVVPREQLMDRCKEIARRIIENVPPMTAQLFKLSLAESLFLRPEEVVRVTERAQRIARSTEDHAEALRAYAEKRKPVWKGK